MALIVRAFILRYPYYTINFRYKNVSQSGLFFAYKNVKQSVRLFVHKNVTQSASSFLGQLIDGKVTCPQKYLSKVSKSPSPGREKIPCKYSARGAKSQPRLSHSADQGNVTKQAFATGKVCRNIEIKIKRR